MRYAAIRRPKQNYEALPRRLLAKGAPSGAPSCYQVRQSSHPLGSTRAFRKSSEVDCVEIDSDSDASTADVVGTGSWIRETIAPSKVSIEIDELNFFECDQQRNEFQKLKQTALKSTKTVENIISNPLKASGVLCFL